MFSVLARPRREGANKQISQKRLYRCCSYKINAIFSIVSFMNIRNLMNINDMQIIPPSVAAVVVVVVCFLGGGGWGVGWLEQLLHLPSLRDRAD